MNFDNVTDVRATVSTILGSMGKETSVNMNFLYFHPGNHSSPTLANNLMTGRQRYLAKNRDWLKELQGGWRQQFSHWNMKQYVPHELR